MGANFPDSPTNGQTTTVGNTTYAYNSSVGAWEIVSSGGIGTMTTKGDLLSRSSSGLARVGVGTNGQVLTADSGETSGMKWDSGPGLVRLTSCTVTSSGGTSATASDGVITIGSGNTQIVVSNAFSSTYDNYRIILSASDCSIDAQGIKLLLSGVTGNNYFCYSTYQSWGTSSPLGTGYASNNSGILVGFGGSVDDTNFVVDVYSPNLTKRTGFTMQSTSASYFINGSGLSDSTVASTGFTIDPDGSATLSGGTIRVYGYRN